MSCGNPHEVPCTEVLDAVYSYLDGEISDADCTRIRQHLDECGPCLREFGLEEAVKRLVGKHCGCDPAPAELRTKVLVRIRQVRAEIEIIDLASVVAVCDYLFTIRSRCALGLRELPLPRYPEPGQYPVSCRLRHAPQGGCHLCAHMAGALRPQKRHG